MTSEAINNLQAVNPGAGGNYWEPDVAIIASVYPAAVVKRHRRNGFETFAIDAAPKGEYRTCAVFGGFENCRIRDSVSVMPVPVDGASVAVDLVREWAEDIGRYGNTVQGRPGIGVIEGVWTEMPAGFNRRTADLTHGQYVERLQRWYKVEPTQDELDRLLAQQEMYFRFLVGEADAYEASGQLKELAPLRGLYSMALHWLGDFSEDRKWDREIRNVVTKRCLACTQAIPIGALVCQHCQQNLVLFCEQIGVVPAEEQDAAVRAQVMRRQARKKGDS